MSTDLHASYPLPCDVETAYAALSSEQWPARNDAELDDGSRFESRESTPDGSRAGTWKAEVPGAPVDVHGTMRLVPTATGCDYLIDGTAKVKIPLIGGKAEKFVADATARTTAAEADVLRSIIGG